MTELDPRSWALVPAIVRATVRPVKPWLILSAVLACLAIIASVASGTGLWVHVSAVLVLHLLVGLVGGFLAHELGHALALRWWAPQVHRLRLEATWTRISITPCGQMTGGQVIAAAVAGPGICIVLGLALSLLPSTWGVQVWFLLHAVFLLPCFGDGRAILASLRAGSAHHWESSSS